MKHLDLFSGYGGFTIPAKKYGIETIGFSEIDKYACSVLNYHYPNIKNYGDITKIKAEDVPTVDIITGGSPCQDLSAAGKGSLESLNAILTAVNSYPDKSVPVPEDISKLQEEIH